MKTQIDTKEWMEAKSTEAIGSVEAIRDHSEIERVELLATAIHDGFKDALTICGVSAMESGKASAFAIYKDHKSITVSDPVIESPDSVCRFGQDLTDNWGVDTRTNDFLEPSNPKHQQLFIDSDGVSPRTDVWGMIIAYPMGELASRFNAKDIRRPTKAWLNFFEKQDAMRPGFITGILTNDGKKSGLLLFKKNENIAKMNTRAFGLLGDGEAIGRDYVLERMLAAGVVYADIDLSCPKNRDPSKLYEKRISTAIDSLY